MRSWSFHLRMHPLAAARSGCLARIIGVFADRGVSLDRVHAGVDRSQPRIELDFVADERTAQTLRRRIERLAEVAELSVADG